MDEIDEKIKEERAKSVMERKGIQVGDFVVFNDGTCRRVTHVWDESAIQTWDESGGSYYLGKGYADYSGALYTSFNAPLTLTEDKRLGWVWFFHHDYWRAHNAVYCQVEFKVWKADCLPPAV